MFQLTTVNSNFRTMSFQASFFSHIVQKSQRYFKSLLYFPNEDGESKVTVLKKNPPTLRTFQLNKMAAELSTLISLFLDRKPEKCASFFLDCVEFKAAI